MSAFRTLAVTSVLALCGSFGCAPSFIPNTDVDDTSANRKIVTFCEDYRHAMEDKNVGQLLKMASPKYHEDGGNTNAEDDIDFEGLKDYLAGVFQKTQAIRYEVRYRKIATTEANRILVDFTYAAAYKIPGLKGDEWHHTVADNRLELVREGESFKILAGM